MVKRGFNTEVGGVGYRDRMPLWRWIATSFTVSIRETCVCERNAAPASEYKEQRHAEQEPFGAIQQHDEWRLELKN